jgi:hypothetical protein
MAELFNVGHETGDLSEYDSTVVDGGDLSAAGGAALAGTSYGLQVVVDDTTAIYGEMDFSPPASYLRFRFYVDPNGFTVNDSQYAVLARPIPYNMVEVVLSHSGAAYWIAFNLYDDSGSYLGTEFVEVTDDAHYVEVLITRGAGSGAYQAWVDGVEAFEETDVDNDSRFDSLSGLVIGAVSFLGTPSGTYYLDEFVARNDNTEIGPVAGGVTVTPDPASAVSATSGPTVSMPVSISPDPASAVSVTAGPTVSAPVTITPTPAAVTASTFSLYGGGDLYFEVRLISQNPLEPFGPDDDVTGFVHSFEFTNGMSAAYQILGKSQARLTLVNTDGRFSPEGAGTLENFTLGRVVWIRVGFAGSVVQLFRGTITKIDPSAGGKGARRCLVTAEGWLSRMRQQPFELPLQTNRRADQIAAAIIDAVGVCPPGYGYGSGYTHFETGVETFPYFADNLDDNARVYDALRVLAASEATGRFFQQRNGKLRFWDRRYLMKQHTVRATFDNTMAEMDYVYGESLRNQVVVKYHPRQYEDDGPYVLSTHDEGIKFRNAQEEKEIYLRYTDEGDITVSTTDPITPVRRVDYWGNDEEDGSGELDFSNALVVSAEHLGTYSKWTVSNSGLSFWMAAGATQRANDRITDRGRQEVRRSDATSIASYGLYPHTIDTKAQPSHNVARALAYWTVGKFSQPRGEIKRLTIRPLRDAALRTQVVERQIGDRVRLKEAQTGVDADYFIVGERWRVGEGAKDVEVSWVVEPAAAHQCLLMDVTGFCEMGSNSRMGY